MHSADLLLIASGLATACATGAAGAARPSLSGRTAQSAIICCVSAVAATSVRNAWAVGGGSRTVILHWNGTAWKRVPSPSLAGGLGGVAVISAGDAWAVGYTGMGPLTCRRCTTLILHWNGTTWKRVPSPEPTAGILEGVAAASAHSAWAVGNTGGGNTLILYWTGTAWEQVHSPNPTPGHGENLTGVAATSARNAWVVGYAGGGGQVLTVHWNR